MSRTNWTPQGPTELASGTSAQAFKRGELTVLVAQEHGRWHLSISAPIRYPTWDEIADARYDLLADSLEMAMFLPPASSYVNLHPFVFHLWEVRDPELPIERGETGHRRTHGKAEIADAVPEADS